MKIFDDKENPARSRLMAHIEWMLDREEKQDAKMTRIANKDAYLS